MRRGIAAPALRGIEIGYLGHASPVYEVTGDGWIVRTASNRAPYSMQSLYQDPHWFDCKWADAERGLSFEWPPR